MLNQGKASKFEINDLPQEWKDELNIRIGSRISFGRTDDEMAEFDAIVDPAQALRWFEKYHIDRSKILEEETQKLLQEYISSNGHLNRLEFNESIEAARREDYNHDYVNISCFGWGPERKTYTMKSRPTHPIFNSITDNPTIGDERNFVRIGEIKKDVTRMSNEIKVEPGKEYLVYIYYFNNADPSSNGKEQGRTGVAFGTKLLAGFTKQLLPGQKGMVCAEIQSNNSQPEAVWSAATITSDCPVSIQFENASAKIYNDWKANGMVLSQDLFSHEGVYLGLNSLDGVILGGGQFHGVVVFKLAVKALDNYISK